MSKTAERTHPELWEQVKAELMASSKGGKAGEWSARKAQLAVQEYKKRGGGWGAASAKSARATASAKPAPVATLAPVKGASPNPSSPKPSSSKTGGEAGEPRVPNAAHDVGGDDASHKTAASSIRREDASRSRAFGRRPEPIVASPAILREARAAELTKPELMEQARILEIEGRSRMSKDELMKAIRYARH